MSLLCFSLGRSIGRLEGSVSMAHKFNTILSAIKKVENLAQLKGEDLSKISPEELIARAEKYLSRTQDE